MMMDLMLKVWRVLRKELLSLDDVMIVAPETEQSAMGHAITLTQPLKIRKVKEDGEFIGLCCQWNSCRLCQACNYSFARRTSKTGCVRNQFGW